jgi:MFS family permease
VANWDFSDLGLSPALLIRIVNHLLLALGAMFLQQTFVALGRALPAVIAPAIITDLRIDAAWVGIYFGLTAAASLVAQLGCGSFIVRHGALRMNQVSLVMVATGTALAALGTPLMLMLSAIICGSGGSVSTPASSHLLSRVSSPRCRPAARRLGRTAIDGVEGLALHDVAERSGMLRVCPDAPAAATDFR